MVLAETLFSEQTTQYPQPRYGEFEPTRSYMHLKIIFSTGDKAAQNSFIDTFSTFMNDYAQQHDLPMGESRTALLTPANPGLLYPKRTALRTQIELITHLTTQEFKDFADAVEVLLEEMPSVVMVKVTNYHSSVVITATGQESL